MATKKNIKAKINKKKAIGRPALALKNLVVNGGHGGVKRALKEAGYSDAYAKNSHKFAKTKIYKDYQSRLKDVLSDEILAQEHVKLLNAHKLDHAVFPLGPVDHNNPKDVKALADTDISDLLTSVNCTMRKVVHGDIVRHVYFWAPDNKTKKDAVELAYKVRDMFPSDKMDVSVSRPFKDLSDDELAEYIRERKKFLLKK